MPGKTEVLLKLFDNSLPSIMVNEETLLPPPPLPLLTNAMVKAINQNGSTDGFARASAPTDNGHNVMEYAHEFRRTL